jgi:hypothetical protein
MAKPVILKVRNGKKRHFLLANPILKPILKGFLDFTTASKQGSNAQALRSRVGSRSILEVSYESLREGVMRSITNRT